LTEEESWKLQRIRLAEHFGWTFEYIDSLSMGEIVDIWQILDGQAKADKSVNRKG
jgi:hypothetical protein